MDEIFGRTIECECGKSHRIEPDEIVFAPDALAQLPGLCGRYAAGKAVLVLSDARTRQVAGAAGVEELARAGWEVREHVVPDPSPGADPVCDDMTRKTLDGLAREADLVLAVGSGVVNDLAKWLAFDEGRPYVSLATAASMNGYSSANVAPAIDGVKTLIRANPPKAVLSAPQILVDAPAEMTAAGLGDVLAKSTSSVDWLLNHLLFGDYYCPRSVGLISQIEPLYLDRPEQVHQADPQAVGAIFQALLLTGAAMTMAETSAPASGGEHLLSHGLDMLSSLDGQPHDLHGRQVGVGTVLACEIYRRVLAVESPEWVEPAEDIDRSFWGRLGDAVDRQYAEKLPRLHQARQTLTEPGRWDALRQKLAAVVRPPERVAECLSRAGAACSAADIGCSRERLLGALVHGHEMRSRYTILDLARLVGVMPRAADEIVAEWT